MDSYSNKIKKTESNIKIYERYEQYQRSHLLRLEHWSMILYGKNKIKDYYQYIYNYIEFLYFLLFQHLEDKNLFDNQQKKYY